MVDVAAEAYRRGIRRGLTQADAWNESSCDWTAAANVIRHVVHVRTCTHLFCVLSLSLQAHCHCISLKAFRESIEYSSLSPANLKIVEALCTLFAVFGIMNYAGEFMIVSPGQGCMYYYDRDSGEVAFELKGSKGWVF